MTSFTGLTFRALTGTFTRAVEVGGVATRVPAVGTVTITADVEDNRVLGINDTPVETINIDPVVVTLDGSGSIGVVNVIDPASVKPDDFTYHIEFSLDEGVEWPGFSFAIDGTTSIDLTQVTPINPYPGTRYVSGPPGPPGPAGGAGFVFTQASPSASWLITHPSSTTPLVQIYDTDGNQVDTDVQVVSDTQVAVIFATPMAGTAVLA